MNLSALLRAFPWPAEYLAKGRPLDWVEQFHINAPRHDLWPVLMDTSRFNRFMGLPEMKYEERQGVMHGATRNAGIQMEWKEIPWSWTSESTMTNAREYSKGIGHFLRAVYAMEPAEQGTNVTIYFGWIPRNFFMRIHCFDFLKCLSEIGPERFRGKREADRKRNFRCVIRSSNRPRAPR